MHLDEGNSLENSMKMMDYFLNLVNEHSLLFARLHEIAPSVIKAGQQMLDSLSKTNKIMICGNGGSASDAQHFAAELIGRFERERKAIPAIAMTTDTSILTALGNDYGYDSVFARQVEGLASAGDTLIGISTSGNSKNVIHAVRYAEKMGVKSIGLLGRDGGELASIVDIPVIVPHSVTARIQETHIFILHFWSAFIEEQLVSS
jgi:D-sedoheptulose 7-phosphate isomerase